MKRFLFLALTLALLASTASAQRVGRFRSLYVGDGVGDTSKASVNEDGEADFVSVEADSYTLGGAPFGPTGPTGTTNNATQRYNTGSSAWVEETNFLVDSSGNFYSDVNGYVKGGNLEIGLNDGTLGRLRLYGPATGATGGGELWIYNAVDHETDTNSWSLKSVSGTLKLRGEGGTSNLGDLLTITASTGHATWAKDWDVGGALKVGGQNLTALYQPLDTDLTDLADGNYSGTFTAGNLVTGGTLQVTGTSALTGNVTVGGDAVAGPQILVNGAAANVRDMVGQTAGVARWKLRLGNSTAESGSNAGSNFNLLAYDDAGALIDTPLTLTRAAAGVFTVARPLTATGTMKATGGQLEIGVSNTTRGLVYRWGGADGSGTVGGEDRFYNAGDTHDDTVDYYYARAVSGDLRYGAGGGTGNWGDLLQFDDADGSTDVLKDFNVTGVGTFMGNMFLGDASTELIQGVGRIVPRAVTDSGMTATAGTTGETVRNTSNNALYEAMNTASPATWAKVSPAWRVWLPAIEAESGGGGSTHGDGATHSYLNIALDDALGVTTAFWSVPLPGDYYSQVLRFRLYYSVAANGVSGDGVRLILKADASGNNEAFTSATTTIGTSNIDVSTFTSGKIYIEEWTGTPGAASGGDLVNVRLLRDIGDAYDDYPDYVFAIGIEISYV